MKKITLLVTFMLTVFAFGQETTHVDFDTNNPNINFASWNNSSTFMKVENIFGNNGFSGQFIAGNDNGIGIGGDTFSTAFDFSTLSYFKMKVYASEAIDVTLHLENDPDWGGHNVEVVQSITSTDIDKWVELTFDFTSVSDEYLNKIVIKIEGVNTEEGDVYYFDDIIGPALYEPSCSDGIQNGDETGVDCGGSSCNVCPEPLTEFNFDFETPTSIGTYNADFNDDAINIVTDGINTSINVGEISDINRDWWSQINYEHSEGIDLSSGDRGFSIKVKGPRALTLTLKVEGSEEHSITADYTTPNVWQELTFDFSSFNSTNNTKIALFFDIQTNFDGGVDPAQDIFQIDDFVFGQFSSLSTEDFVIEGLNVYPNPTSNSWRISTKDQIITSVEILDLLGRNVMSIQSKKLSLEIDASNLPIGVYVAKISTVLGTTSKKLIKQ